MGKVDGLGDHLHNADRLTIVDGRRIDQFLKGPSLDILHGKVGTTVDFADIVYWHDTRMLELGRRACLCEKTLTLGIRCQLVFENHLDGYLAPETDLFGAIDHPHTTASDFFDQAVVAKDARESQPPDIGIPPGSRFGLIHGPHFMNADRIGHDDGTPKGLELLCQCWMLAAKWMLATDLVQVDGLAFLQSVGQFGDQQSQILVDL